jgi:hypothetical protein
VRDGEHDGVGLGGGERERRVVRVPDGVRVLVPDAVIDRVRETVTEGELGATTCPLTARFVVAVPLT